MPCLKNKNCTKKENNTKYNRCDKDKLTDKKWYIMYYNTCKSHDFSKNLNDLAEYFQDMTSSNFLSLPL